MPAPEPTNRTVRDDLAVLWTMAAVLLVAGATAWCAQRWRTTALALPIDDTVELRVDVNTAGLAQLDLLPGVGPAIGGRIIAERSEHGPFIAPLDLQRVHGIGQITASRIAPYIVFKDRHVP